MDKQGEAVELEDLVWVLANIPVAGLQRGGRGQIPRSQAISLAQGTWVTILDDPPEEEKGEPDGLSGLWPDGNGDVDQTDHPGGLDLGTPDPGDAVVADGQPDAG